MFCRVNVLAKPMKRANMPQKLLLLLPSSKVEQRHLSTASTLCNVSTEGNVGEQPAEAKKNISKAMKAYLERAREHDAFMEQQNYEFQIGKRQLANMMGEDPETFTQEDINNAIAYLFPSGLYEKKARPMMLPPEMIFPNRKAAEFDETGRPYHFLFYTGRPNYYKLLYDIVEQINKLYKYEDVMIKKGAVPDPNSEIEESGYQWIDKESLEKLLVETLSDQEYDNFINVLERLRNLPYSYTVRDFIFQYKRALMNQTKATEVAKLQYDNDGRSFVTTYECRRKNAIGNVTIRSPGTGKIMINGKGITYFEDRQSREQASLVLGVTNNKDVITHFILFLQEKKKDDAE